MNPLPRFYIHRDRSGRRRAIYWWKYLAYLFLAAALMGALLVGLSLYTPAIHGLAGDWTGVNFKRIEVPWIWQKVVGDNVAALFNVLFVKEPTLTSKVPTVTLWVDKNGFDSLNRDIWRFGLGDFERKPRVQGYSVLEDGSQLRASIAYRGTNTWHHQFWKPSLRIRYRKSTLADGFRNHILVAAEDPIGMRNWLSVELSRQLGMLNNGEHFVRLFINRRYKGVYTRQWRLDESLLIEANRLPGPFFRLEAGTGPIFRRVYAVYDEVSTWEINGDAAGYGTSTLQEMVDTIRMAPSVERQTRINDIFDRAAYAKWLAVLCHSGEIHVGRHNIAFWLDTTSGLFVPTVADVNGYAWTDQYTDTVRTPILLPGEPAGRAWRYAWVVDPNNLKLYVDQLDALLRTHGSAKSVERLIRDKWAEIRRDAMADLYTSELGAKDRLFTRSFFSILKLDANVDALVTYIWARTTWLRGQLNVSRLSVTGVKVDDTFEVLVQGYAGVIAHRRGTADTIELLPSALPRYDWTDKRHEDPMWTYAFHTLAGHPSDYDFVHRLSGHKVSLTNPPENVSELRAEMGIHPNAFPSPSTEDLVIGPGEVSLKLSLVSDENQPVIVRAGTQLLLGPDVSIIVRGPLMVEGTEHLPVFVRPLDPAKPFGVIAVLGKGTTGSRISYMDIEGGSVYNRNNLRFSGMLSIRDSTDVIIRACRFGKNFIGDDTLHIVRSTAHILDSNFEDAQADALDLDLVDGTITNCRFLRSGNDGIDLSMGKVTISNCFIDGSGDKCLSAGEGTTATVESSLFRHAPIGVAVKDSAKVTMRGCKFVGCDIGWSSYMKKWRWGRGGSGWLKDTTFEGSTDADVHLDDRSVITFVGGMPSNISTAGSGQINSDAHWPEWVP